MREVDTRTERVFGLWEQLAHADCSQPRASREALLRGIVEVVGGTNAHWVAAVRSTHPVSSDPLRGWRYQMGQYLNPPRASEALIAAHHAQARTAPNEITIRGLEHAGRARAYLLSELVSEGWFDSEYFHQIYAPAGIADSIFVALPVSERSEVCVAVQREAGEPAFTAADRDLAELTLRGLGWLHRQHLLSAGYFIAKTPLSPTERAVLTGLLSGNTAKQIATSMGHSVHTTHEYVSRIYRKYEVSDRAGLLSLWMGRRPENLGCGTRPAYPREHSP